MYIYNEASLRVTGFVRETFRQLQSGLQAFMPNVSVDSIDFEIQAADRTNKSVPYRAFDAPGVPIENVGYAVETGRLQPITAIDIVSESRRHDIRKQALGGDISGAVADYIDDRSGELIRRVANRIELARGEVLSTGLLSLAENGVEYAHDFGTPATVTTGTAWATHATADPIGDLFARAEAARDSGYELKHAIMSSTAIADLQQNADLIAAVPAAAGVTPLLSPAQVAAAVQTHTGLTIHRYDYQVDGSRVIAADIVVLLPEVSAQTLGATEFGVTAEQMELGIDFSGSEPNVVGMVSKTMNPVNVQTLVAALAVPVLKDGAAVQTLDIAP